MSLASLFGRLPLTDLLIGAVMSAVFGALLLFARRTGTMPSIVPTVDSADKDSGHWYWVLGALNTFGFVAGIAGVIKGIYSI